MKRKNRKKLTHERTAKETRLISVEIERTRDWLLLALADGVNALLRRGSDEDRGTEREILKAAEAHRRELRLECRPSKWLNL